MPNFTVTGDVTLAPFAGSIMKTLALAGALEISPAVAEFSVVVTCAGLVFAELV